MKGKEGMKKPVSTTVITLLILILLSGCGNAEKYANFQNAGSSAGCIPGRKAL